MEDFISGAFLGLSELKENNKCSTMCVFDYVVRNGTLWKLFNPCLS